MLERAAGALGLPLAGGQIDRLLRYVDLVRDRNRRVNLVSRRDTDRLVSYHLPDSLAAVRFVRPGDRVADIGSGAGLPGIPLAVACPEAEMLLVESSGKKCRFMEAAIASLGLTNARVLNARSEELEPLGCRLVFSRVTGPLDRVLRQLHGHRDPGGTIVFYKSVGWEEAFNRARPVLERLGLAVGSSVEVELPMAGIRRCFVIVEQQVAT